MLAGCASSEERDDPSAAQPAPESAPADLRDAAEILNTTRDGPNVPWSARLAAYGVAEGACGVDVSVRGGNVIIFRAVGHRGGWNQVEVDMSTRQVLSGRSRGGLRYPDQFGAKTAEEIVAGSWKCSFTSPNAYERVEVLDERNPEAVASLDAVSAVITQVAGEEIRNCATERESIDGVVIGCTERWSGGRVEVTATNDGTVLEVALPSGRVIRP